ncbi:MAG: ketoacyl-ACP synthase III [Gemmatimonadetes bacterium]|nr:ketoacyl-ACP synthase III [Gemmatimonadota bacterium]MBI3569205.1 ketoacyl-ACP synthase III [Gemmatimonadota bacterium]
MATERHAIITGTGAAVPERIVTNAELSAILGEDIDPFVRGTLGIAERHVCGAHESTAGLAVDAARRALDMAECAVADVDLLIIATDTPEYISPPTASVVHGRLGLPTRCGTFDINAGCAGFVTALDTAWKFIRADERYRRVLVVGAYAMSKFIDWKDKKTSTIFADGAGAALVERSDRPGVLASELFADGSLCSGMGVFAGGAAEPITADVLASGHRNHLRFVQKYPASVNEQGWPRIVRAVLERAGHVPRDVDHWLWTQVNLSTIKVVMESLGEPMAKAHTVMHKWGYTGSACLPMALDDAVRAGKVKDGQLIVFTGSGAGLAMGSVAMRWRGRA